MGKPPKSEVGTSKLAASKLTASNLFKLPDDEVFPDDSASSIGVGDKRLR